MRAKFSVRKLIARAASFGLAVGVLAALLVGSGTGVASSTPPAGTGLLNCPQASSGIISYKPPTGTGPSAVEQFNFTYTDCTDTGKPTGSFTVNLTAKFTVTPNSCPWYSTGTPLTFELTYSGVSGGLASSYATTEVENSTVEPPFEAYWSFTSAAVTGSFPVSKTPVFKGKVWPPINSFHLTPVKGSGCNTRELKFYGVPPASAEDTLNRF